MSKASEDALGELHGEVARTLTEIVRVRKDGDSLIVPGAAHIAAAIAFLKNNNITADASSNAELDELNRTLKERRARGKGRLNLTEAVETLERDLGGKGGDFLQ